ncbi:MAG: ATPase, T2SS/T4P/T4SS family [Vicinamibacterales bacterium]|nr:ATPase, T2SS/T4P/T4SS family [Vicinamibacterales bacterium]
MSKQLEVVLRHSGVLTPDVLARCVEQARRRNVPLLDVVLKEGHISDDSLADAFSKYLRLPRIRLANSESDPEALKKVPDKIVRKHVCMPLSIDGKTMVVAMANPTDYLALQDIEFASGLSVKPVVASRTELLDAIEQRYSAADRLGSFLANVPDVEDMQIVADDSSQDLDIGDAQNAAEVAPVVKMVNLVVFDAIKSGASDLHIEPTLHDVNVRMRVDGVLRDYTNVPKWLHSPVISRLKILAKLDISERRLPQDGRINVQYQGRSIDIRVSTLPTHFGEKAVLRVLGGSSVPKVDKLGLNEAQQAMLEAAIMQPQGIILVTGPTGSGKSTTLYALLQRRKSPEVNIITVEDPIEYQLAGINQVQVNTKAGLSFASVLRSILRQDPDVILVGEMRDEETAEVAFQAAMTGHLVLSTLHTNSAVAAVSRLFDINVDSSILSTSLTLAIAQRLVRRICALCKEPYQPDAATMQKLGLTAADGQVFRGKGCPACGGTGFSGRLGIYEFFKPTTTIRKLIHEKVGEVELRNAARQSGMKLLREDAADKIRQGLTSPEEVLRVVQVDENEVPCPNCKALIEPDFAVCPYCLYTIRRTCQSCGQNLKPDWKACPYCNAVAQVQALAEPIAPTATATATDKPEPPPMPPPPPPPLHHHHPGASGDETHEGDGVIERREPIDRREPKERRLPEKAGKRSGKGSDKSEDWPTGLTVFDFDTLASASSAVAPVAPPPVAAPPVAPEMPPEAPPPVAPPPVAPPPVAPPPVAPPSEAVPAGRSLRVLVVDDDEDIRQVVAFTLRKLPMKVEVTMAEDGQDAVEKATASPPDLVVLDVMMPRMDGFETCQHLRQNVRTAFVPILMLTASADESSRTKGYLMGTDDYMSKPFLPPDLNLRVTRLLRRSYGI